MKQRESVKKLMTTDLHTVNPTQKLSEVYDIMNEHEIHHVPVVEGDVLVGLLTANDLMRFSYGNIYTQDERTLKQGLDLCSIRDAMSEDLITVDVHGTVKEAVDQLSTGDFHALPVVDNGKLAGLLTSTDVIRYLRDQY